MIKSSVEVAQEAVAGFKTIDKRWKITAVGMTNIAGVRTAFEASNWLHNSLSELDTEVRKQKDKFPELATKIEERDKADAAQLSGGMCTRT